MKVIIIFLLLFSFHSFAQECTNEAKFISAQYEISEMVPVKGNSLKGNLSSTLLEFHRQGNRVLQRFSDVGFSNIWRQGAHGRISLLRAFDEYQHAIEYQPSELSYKPNWQSIYQPISIPALNEMVLLSQTGKGCELKQYYQLQTDSAEYRVTWLPKLALVSYFQIQSNTINKEWQLSSHQVSSERSTLLFREYDNYRSTDYADIGDNEAMPFLAKMINQGFSSAQVVNRQQHSHQH
ncbi:hypothetical protein [Cognaticolwellia mytili]|uniref:hypothetical protein n=1 Tax=Cognaticolwellia mytili TaxID=1888913 RepID=UPI000A17559C|nr:hypothetical protein [Cognaticolwellia mytili]